MDKICEKPVLVRSTSKSQASPADLSQQRAQEKVKVVRCPTACSALQSQTLKNETLVEAAEA